MELVIALLGGAAGGSLISGLSPKVSISLWKSLVGGLAGGAALYLVSTYFFIPGGAKASASPDILSLLGLVTTGFAGGAAVLWVLFLLQLRKQS